MTYRNDEVVFIDILNCANELVRCADDHPELLTQPPDWGCRETYFASLLPVIRLGNAVRRLSPAGRQNFSAEVLRWIDETSEQASHYDQFQLIDPERYNKFFSDELRLFRDRAKELAPAEPS